MTRATAYQKRHAKARQRRRRTAQERLARDRRQTHTPPRPFSRPSMTWGCLKTS
jgi:hypothetical protein